MRKRLILAIFLFLLSGLSFLGIKFLKDRQQFRTLAVLQVTATPKSQVYLDGELLGQTPYFSDKLKSGEQTIKVVPLEGSGFFEQKIKLAPFLLTAVDRTFRANEAQNEGVILTLEELQDKNATELVLLSSPQEAKVFLDNDLKGVAPLDLKEIPPSEHEIALSMPGFIDKRTRVKISNGYKLIADFKLAVSPEEASPASTPVVTPTKTASASAKIKQTPTGFLRVRLSPSLNASEVGQVKPGNSFPILDEAESWTKISLPSGISGWVSNQYIIKP